MWDFILSEPWSYFIAGNIDQNLHLYFGDFFLLFLNTLEPVLRLRQLLEKSAERWRGKFGSIHFPFRLPKITQLDSFWDALKQKILSKSLPYNRKIIKARIREAINELDEP